MLMLQFFRRKQSRFGKERGFFFFFFFFFGDLDSSGLSEVIGSKHLIQVLKIYKGMRNEVHWCRLLLIRVL